MNKISYPDVKAKARKQHIREALISLRTRMRLAILVSVLYNIADIQCLTCGDILALPSDKKWTLETLKTIPPKDVVECLAHLGKEQLPIAEAEFIWQTLVTFHEGIENIPDSLLMILHWITPAVKPEDYANITLDSIDVVENFGLNYNLNQDQLAAIADRVRDDFAGKYPEDYSYYDLTALRQILCAFNRSEIEKIHPSAYREAAVMIGKLGNCAAQVMIGFATLAMAETAFGSPNGWSESTVKTLGTVAEYLPKDIVARFKVSVDSNKT